MLPLLANQYRHYQYVQLFCTAQHTLWMEIKRNYFLLFSCTASRNVFFFISSFGIYGAAVVPDSGVGNTWQETCNNTEAGFLTGWLLCLSLNNVSYCKVQRKCRKKRRQLIIISKSHVWVGTRKEESLETLSENHEWLCRCDVYCL